MAERYLPKLVGHLIDFRVKHKPGKRTVRFRITVVDNLGRTVVYRGQGRYDDPDTAPTFSLDMQAHPVEVGFGLLARTIGSPVTLAASMAFHGLNLDPSEPMTRTIKPKRVPSDG